MFILHNLRPVLCICRIREILSDILSARICDVEHGPLRIRADFLNRLRKCHLHMNRRRRLCLAAACIKECQGIRIARRRLLTLCRKRRVGQSLIARSLCRKRRVA